MTITSIKATIDCDGCNKSFTVTMDRGGKPPEIWDLDQFVEDAVRGGNAEAGMTSVQGEHLLCERCTKIVNELPQDAPTREQVERKLNEAQVEGRLE